MSVLEKVVEVLCACGPAADIEMLWKMAVSYSSILVVEISDSDKDRFLKDIFDSSCSINQVELIAQCAVLASALWKFEQGRAESIISIASDFLFSEPVMYLPKQLSVIELYIINLLQAIPRDSEQYKSFLSQWFDAIKIMNIDTHSMLPTSAAYSKAKMLGVILSSHKNPWIPIEYSAVTRAIECIRHTNNASRQLLVKALLPAIFANIFRSSNVSEKAVTESIILQFWSLTVTVSESDLNSASSVICIILNSLKSSQLPLSDCHVVMIAVFEHHSFWPIVIKCLLNDDAVVRKRGGFMAQQFISLIEAVAPFDKKSAKAALKSKSVNREKSENCKIEVPNISRHWIYDVIEAYRQIEGCSYIHLVFQVYIFNVLQVNYYKTHFC